jgi:putative Mn2+ efflux pump MntP
MTFLEIFLISLGLSMDCFAVSLGFGASRLLKWKEILKMACFFGFFQGLMPLIGWFVGQSIQSLISSFDHWIAFGILAFIGIRMIIESFKIGEEKKFTDIRKTTVLLSLSVATSIDALATGVSFGFIRVNIFQAIVTITLITFLNSIIGARIGQKSTFIPARWAEILGGTVLIGIGVKILLDHLGIL